MSPSAGSDPGGDRGGGGSLQGLRLDDVLDLRAYERVREGYRARVIARKQFRRVGLGPIMTLVFECFDTVRFQVQEMARVEKIISDEAIQVELDIYNRLLPRLGELSATLFIELTTDAELREWLPKLVGDGAGARHRGGRRRRAERARGRACRRPDPGDRDAGRPLPALSLLRGPGGPVRERRRGGAGVHSSPSIRPGPSSLPRCAESCSETSRGQQSR